MQIRERGMEELFKDRTQCDKFTAGQSLEVPSVAKRLSINRSEHCHLTLARPGPGPWPETTV